jgi:hypothetical protein
MTPRCCWLRYWMLPPQPPPCWCQTHHRLSWQHQTTHPLVLNPQRQTIHLLLQS